MNPRPQVAPITDAAALRRIHRDILSVCFPRKELSSADEFVTFARSGFFRVWGLAEGTDAIGVAVVEGHVEAPEVALLAWLAMRPGHRASGGGRQLLGEVTDTVRRGGVRVLLGEMEDPGGAASDAFGDPARRARFYAALGARALLVPHDQPSVGEGFPPVPLLLFGLPLGEGWDASLARPILRFLTAYRQLAVGSRERQRLIDLMDGGDVPLGDLTTESFAATRLLAS